MDHTDDRAGYLGPSHRACNRATAGAVRGARVGRSEPDPEWKGWVGPTGIRWCRQWLEEGWWLGDGPPPPGTSLADRERERA